MHDARDQAGEPVVADGRPAATGGSRGGDEHETLLDEVADRLGFRGVIRRNPVLNLVYRVVIGVLGASVMVLGFALIPLPGPGWLIVFGGLAILATEFEWAERLLHYGRDKLRAWTRWVQRQSVLVRALLGLAGLALVAGVFLGYDQVVGLPGWVPVLG